MKQDEFLNNLDKLSSFNKKIQYANENLNRLGSGSGRIVYDLGDDKVLKLARNRKGIAQNEEEISIGTDPYGPEVVAKVYDHHPDGEWIVAEKAKKVSEKRIKELTEIPSLFRFSSYLGNMFGPSNWNVSDEDKSKLDDNEWVQDVSDLVGSWGQHTGDFGRPSTYGEVVRDGDPEIVVTDYGLSDEVFSTHYAPKRERRYQMYEMVDMNRGGIYDEFSDGGEHRRAFWALQPYSVSDGDGVVNEEFVNYLENNNDTGVIRRPIFNLTGIAEEFNNVVGNLSKYNEKASNPRTFYENLLKLQKYLNKKGLYDKETVSLDEQDIPVKKWTLDREQSDKLAEFLNGELSLGGLSYIGGGGNGYAYKFSGDKVLKITADPSEADSALKIQGRKPETTPNIYNVYKITDNETNQAFFVIVQEFIENQPREKFIKYNTTIAKIADATGNKDHIGILKKAKRDFNYDEYLRKFDHILNNDLSKFGVSNEMEEELRQYIIGLLNIQKDLTELNIKSDDYLSGDNLGYKDGKLVFFDVGGYRAEEPKLPQQAHIEYNLDEIVDMVHSKLKESGDAKFSTQDSIGRLDFPPQNNVTLEPPIDNNLKANSAMYFNEDKKFGEGRVQEIYNLLKDKLNFTQLEYLGSGYYGDAFDVGNNRVMKITTDKSEAVENLELLRKDLNYIAKPYSVLKLHSKKANRDLYVIILEKLRTDSSISDKMMRLRYALGSILDVSLYDIIDEIVYDASFGDYVENKEKIDKYLNRNPQDKEFLNSLLNIAREVKKLGVESADFMNPENLGYNKKGELAFFDLGFANPYKEPQNKPEEYDISEKVEQIDEEFIGHIENNNKEFEVFKNPNSIKRMKSYIRAIATKDGDLFVVNDNFNLIHNDITSWLVSNGHRIPINTYENLDEVVPLQRYEKTNRFYLSESLYPDEIGENIDSIKEILQKTKQKNPTIEFITSSINTLHEDRKKSYMPNSKTVKVKDKCKIGGLGNTSVACNQGDISNLEFGAVNEAVAQSQEEVENFIKDSKVKETVYHGSPVGGLVDIELGSNFVTSSGLREDGMFFTSNPKLADLYRTEKKVSPEYKKAVETRINRLNNVQKTVRNNKDYDEIEAEKNRLKETLKGDIYGVKLKIKNPLIFDAKGKHGIEGWNELKIDLGYKIASGKEVIELIGKKRDVAKDYWKYDGIIAKNILDFDYMSFNTEIPKEIRDKYHGDVYVVFSPNQILIVNQIEDQIGKNNNLEFGAVNEEELEPYNPHGDREYEVFKNPKSIKRMQPYIRGIIDKNGDLYVINDPFHVTHTPFNDYLKKLGYPVPNNIHDIKQGGVPVQRYDDTYNFYLGESMFEENIITYRDNIIEILKKAKRKNPQYNFVVERISDADDEDDETNTTIIENDSQEQQEGVGDKYLEKKHGFKPEFSDFEDDYRSYKNVEDKQEILRTKNFGNIIKNPQSLKNIGSDVRGIIDKGGNLFLEEKSTTIHENLIHILDELNQIEYRTNWHLRNPDEFITIQRVGNTNDFVLGESNEQMRPEFARSRTFTIPVPSRKEAKPVFQKFIDLANKRFPFANFKNELYIYYDQPEGFADEFDELDESLISSTDSVYKNKTDEEIKELVELLDSYKQKVENNEYLSQEDAEEVMYVYRVIKLNHGKYTQYRGFENVSDDLEFIMGVLRKYYPYYFKEGLNENKKSDYTKTKDQLMRSRSIPKEMKEKISKYLTSGSRYENSSIYALLIPKIKGKSFDGVSMGADKDGFFVYTHRARSESKESPEKIPQKDLDYIETTG